ncbi:hypothetical protein DY000_02040524 [Brassica cretica]|uniref:Transposase MuDR plant domain-containing protein n=1 Tax=Brassica cretica TaxID=69181 RepID=A0ABQ7BKG7_BRACR|nr:hypothetical protein DY000_02040524 [Brassica cretica]
MKSRTTFYFSDLFDEEDFFIEKTSKEVFWSMHRRLPGENFYMSLLKVFPKSSQCRKMSAWMIRLLTVVYGEWLFRDNCWDFVVDNVKGTRMCFLSDSSTHADLVEMAQEDYNLDTNREMIRLLTVVYGEWLFRDNCWDFVVDNVKGTRMCFLSDSSTHADLVEMAQEDYNLDTNREVVDFTYSLPEEMMQQMAPDTPPIHVTNDRQVRNLIEICKTHDVRLCVSSRGMMIVSDATEVSDEGEDVNKVSDKGEEEDYEDGNEEEEDADVPNFAEVNEDDFVDYSVYGKVKDEDEDEIEADDMCFEGFKAPYASEGGSSNMAFSDNIYVTKALVVAKCRVAGCGWKLRVVVKHGTNTFWVTKYLKTTHVRCRIEWLNGNILLQKIADTMSVQPVDGWKFFVTGGKRNCIDDLQQMKCDCGYSHNIYPCAGEVEIRKCLPPEIKRGPGRQKKSRWQSWLELSRFRGHKPRKLHKDYSCSNCKQPGHTRPNCNQPVL